MKKGQQLKGNEHKVITFVHHMRKLPYITCNKTLLKERQNVGIMEVSLHIMTYM